MAAVRAAELSMKSPGLPEHIQHRRQVDVHAHAAQVRGRAGAGAARRSRRISGPPDLLLGPDGRPGSRRTIPPSWSVISSSGEPHRIEAAGVGLILLAHRADLSRAGDVRGEEDDPGRLAVPDERQQPRRRGEAAVAVDHPLAGQLRAGELRNRRRQAGLARSPAAWRPPPPRARRTGAACTPAAVTVSAPRTMTARASRGPARQPAPPPGRCVSVPVSTPIRLVPQPPYARPGPPRRAAAEAAACRCRTDGRRAGPGRAGSATGQVGPDGHDARGVNGPVYLVVVALDVIEVDGVAEAPGSETGHAA